MLNNKKIKELQEDIIGLKQINEQLELALSKSEQFIINNYPSINNFEISKGWHSGAGTSTYKVIIDVFAEDLHKLIRMLTNNKLREEKWSMIKSDIKERLRIEIRKEYENSHSKEKD